MQATKDLVRFNSSKTSSLLQCNKASGLASNISRTCGLNTLKTKLSLCTGIFKGYLHRQEQGRWQPKMLIVHTLMVLHSSENPLVQDQTSTPDKITPDKAVPFTKLLFIQLLLCV